MAGLHLVTGHSGTPHVTSADQGVLNAMIMGEGDYVLTKGRKFEAQIVNDNTVNIYDGSLVMNGRHVNLDSGTNVVATISNGSTGMYRHDIIAVRYTLDTTSGVESVSLEVISGTPSTSSATDPTITNTDSILDGATTHDMPLYRVVLNGTTLEKVEPLFNVLAPMVDFQHGFYNQNMLINGDFQCNQRGQKNYSATKTMYTLDMWRAYQVAIKTRKDGIELTGLSATEQGYLTQFIQLGLLETKTYTISTKVDGQVYTFTVTPGGSAKEQNFGKFKISILTLSAWDNDLPEYNYYDNKLKINICPIGTNTVVINYIDVFEGSVAYPHVKEDPATAMMRCRRYLQCGTYFSPYLWFKTEGTENVYSCTLPYDPMVKKPSVLNCNAWYYASDSQKRYASTHTDVTPTDVSKIRSAFDFELNLGTDKLHERCLGFKMVYILSCEHQPNG